MRRLLFDITRNERACVAACSQNLCDVKTPFVMEIDTSTEVPNVSYADTSSLGDSSFSNTDSIRISDRKMKD